MRTQRAARAVGDRMFLELVMGAEPFVQVAHEQRTEVVVVVVNDAQERSTVRS